jgi:hypothetical protein
MGRMAGENESLPTWKCIWCVKACMYSLEACACDSMRAHFDKHAGFAWRGHNFTNMFGGASLLDCAAARTEGLRTASTLLQTLRRRRQEAINQQDACNKSAERAQKGDAACQKRAPLGCGAVLWGATFPQVERPQWKHGAVARASWVRQVWQTKPSTLMGVALISTSNALSRCGC